MIACSTEMMRSVDAAVQEALAQMLIGAVAQCFDGEGVAALTAGSPLGSPEPGDLLAAISGGAPVAPVLIGGYDVLLKLTPGVIRDIQALGIPILPCAGAAGKLIAIDGSGFVIGDGPIEVATARHAAVQFSDGASPEGFTWVESGVIISWRCVLNNSRGSPSARARWPGHRPGRRHDRAHALQTLRAAQTRSRHDRRNSGSPRFADHPGHGGIVEDHGRLTKAEKSSRVIKVFHQGGPAPTQGPIDGVVVDGVAQSVVVSHGPTEALEARIKALEAQPRGLVYKGIWSAGEIYAPGDCVTRQGGMWVCKVHQCQSKPGDNAGVGWQLAVKSGRDGRDLR